MNSLAKLAVSDIILLVKIANSIGGEL